MSRKMKTAEASSAGQVHSDLGASGAERWMKCPGSVTLIRLLGPNTGEDPDYTKDGQEAHALAAHCIEHSVDAWEAMARYPRVTSEISSAVQVYIDYIRSLDGRIYVENTVEHRAFHEAAFGTLDACALDIDPATLDQDVILGELLAEFVDYKNGVGVTVEIEDNAQLKYYAKMKMDGSDWPADLPRLPDNARVRLTIAQPRVTWHPDGLIRSWDTTAGAIREWADRELRPAMVEADGGSDKFDLGAHCQFCPAKLVCPKMRNLAADAGLVAVEMKDGVTLPLTDDAWLGSWYKRVPQLAMFINAITAAVKRRMGEGGQIDGAKMVYGRVDRVWKDDAPLEVEFGLEAWRPATLRSPAMVAELPGGKAFVAEWAMKPQAPLTVAPVTDKRAAVTIQTDAEAFASVKLEG